MTVYRTTVLSITCTLLLGFLAGCSSLKAQPTALKVFAAASLHDAMNQAMMTFQQENPQVNMQRNFASSAQLAIQLTQGAEADIFASADLDQMAFVQSNGDLRSEPVIFATNELLILVPDDNPAEIQGISDLANEGVRVVLTVPGTPLRSYSDQVLMMLSEEFSDAGGLADRIMDNVVSEEENARQAVAKIALGEADAAFAYRSDAVSDLAEDSQVIELPAALNVKAEYPIALTAREEPHPLADQFLAFILSPEGQRILVQWGFGPSPER